MFDEKLPKYYLVKKAIVENMEDLGLSLSDEKNDVRGKEALLSTDDSKVKIYVVPTNEELAIARETVRLVNA